VSSQKEIYCLLGYNTAFCGTVKLTGFVVLPEYFPKLYYNLYI